MEIKVDKDLQEVFDRLGRGLVELFSHTLMAAGILGASKLLETWTNQLWGKSPLLFERIPVRYLFDGFNFGLLVGFFSIGVVTILIAYFRGGQGRGGRGGR